MFENTEVIKSIPTQGIHCPWRRQDFTPETIGVGPSEKFLSRVSSRIRGDRGRTWIPYGAIMAAELKAEEGFLLVEHFAFKWCLDFFQRWEFIVALFPRYWHSTATYGIATEVSGGLQYLPPAHHPVYQWPGDLLKPDLVLLLTVNPEERVKRLQGRGLEKTKEEAELEANNVFRQKYVFLEWCERWKSLRSLSVDKNCFRMQSKGHSSCASSTRGNVP